MKFIVFRLVFTLLEVEASAYQTDVFDATIAIPKQNEAAHSTALGKHASIHKVTHVSAQSTIPTKIAHASAVSMKPKMAVAALTGVKKSDGVKSVSPKHGKEVDKSFNKTNHWGLEDAKSDATPAKHAKQINAKASTPKAHANSSTKQVTTTAPNHTQKAAPTATKGHPDEHKDAKPDKSTVGKVNQKVSKSTVPKAVPKEVKSTKAAAANKTVSHSTASVEAASNVPNANKTVSHGTAIVKAAPNTPHALVSAKAKSHANSEAAIGAENKAEYQLLNFLATEMKMGKKELPPFEVYLPACLEHVHDLIDNLDMAYTDVQLHSVLVDECWLKKSFPESHDSSFSTDSACKKFGVSLLNARYLELQTGSQEGYEGFCADYYVHIGGSLGKEKKAEAPEPKKKTTQSFPWHFVVVAAAILILFLILLCCVLAKRHSNAA